MFRLLPYGTIRKNCPRSHRRQSNYSGILNYSQECRVKAVQPYSDIYKISKIFEISKYFGDYFIGNQCFYCTSSTFSSRPI